MNANKLVRQGHRWLSMIFMAFVLANIAVNITGAGGESVALAIGMTTLLPLVLLMLSGCYLFALPYLAKRRRTAD